MLIERLHPMQSLGTNLPRQVRLAAYPKKPLVRPVGQAAASSAYDHRAQKPNHIDEYC